MANLFAAKKGQTLTGLVKARHKDNQKHTKLKAQASSHSMLFKADSFDWDLKQCGNISFALPMSEQDIGFVDLWDAGLGVPVPSFQFQLLSGGLSVRVLFY